MKTINKCILVGNLVRDPKTNQTKKGDYVCNATIATNTSPTNKPQFTDIVLWNKSAELFPQLAIKGSRVYVEGYINTYTHEDNQKTEVVVSDFIVLDRLEEKTSKFIEDSMKDEEKNQQLDPKTAILSDNREKADKPIETEYMSIKDIPSLRNSNIIKN